MRKGAEGERMREKEGKVHLNDVIKRVGGGDDDIHHDKIAGWVDCQSRPSHQERL